MATTDLAPCLGPPDS